MIELVGWAITVAAVGGAILNNTRRRACFLVWMATNAASCAIHLHVGLIGLAARDVAFFALSIHGLAAWGRAPRGASRGRSQKTSDLP